MCCHVQCVHWCLTLWRLCRHRPRGAFSLIRRQLNAPNSGRTKRGARLASDEIYVETQWTLKVSMPPPSSSPLHMAPVSPMLGAVWGCEWSRPGGAAVPGQRVHWGEWQMPEQNLGIHFSAPSCAATASTPKLPTLLFLAEMLHHNGSNQEEDPWDKPAGQQNNWFHFMIEIKCSYWKWKDDTLWHKIVEARKKKISAI